MNEILCLLQEEKFDLESLKKNQDKLLDKLLNYFADQVDNKIQTELDTELVNKYTTISKKLEAANKKLQIYNDQLEKLVNEKAGELTTSQIAVIHALVKLSESRDDDTGAHIERTSGYCGFIAEKLLESNIYTDTVDGMYVRNIEKASPLHDIGKVGIMDAILLKPARLTVDEFNIMKTHVTNGYMTLESVEKIYPGNEFIKLGLEISLYHHEKWDGSGYMSGLAGERIPLSARIMALSDVYDALRSKRVYKEAFSHEKAVEIIAQGRGKHFDPYLTDTFLNNHEMFLQIYDEMNALKAEKILDACFCFAS